MSINSDDIAKLLLRVTVGVLLFFHGFEKIQNGINGIQSMLTSHSLPQFLGYGVYVGEIAAPIMLILGFYSRIGAVLILINMIIAIALAHSHHLFALGKHGAPIIELPLMYMVLSIVILLIGSGKYSINQK